MLTQPSWQRAISELCNTTFEKTVFPARLPNCFFILWPRTFQHVQSHCRLKRNINAVAAEAAASGSWAGWNPTSTALPLETNAWLHDDQPKALMKKALTPWGTSFSHARDGTTLSPRREKTPGIQGRRRGGWAPARPGLLKQDRGGPEARRRWTRFPPLRWSGGFASPAPGRRKSLQAAQPPAPGPPQGPTCAAAAGPASPSGVPRSYGDAGSTLRLASTALGPHPRFWLAPASRPADQ